MAVVHFFFFNDTATTEIYTLSLHDALPISWQPEKIRLPNRLKFRSRPNHPPMPPINGDGPGDRKSTRLNSSHVRISYAVFCLKKKKKQRQLTAERRTEERQSTR